MQEELIAYNIAILAKEKGFDWETDYLFLNGKSERGGFNDGNGWENRKLDWNSPHFERVRKGEIQYSQPTQSLLQTWLRREKQLYVTVEFYSCKKFGDRFLWDIINKNVLNNYGDPIHYNLFDGIREIHYNSYEEALETGLLEALKLIK